MGVTRRFGLVVVASVLVVGLVLAGAVVPGVAADAAARQSQPETDNTVTRVEVYDNGTARWTIQIRTRLDTDRRAEEYAAFQSRFRNETARYLDPLRERMRGLVSNAANATGREMRATNFAASTRIQEVPRRWGVVTYEFTWTSFAARRNGSLVVGDVFQGGFFIAANDTLQLEAPSDHEIDRVDPAPATRDGRQVTWVGREDFPDGRPRVVFAPVAARGTATTGPGTDAPSSPGGDGAPLGGVGPAALVGLLLLGVLGVGAFALARRRADDTGDTTTGADAATTPPTSADDAGPDGDAPVMTDRERVLTLLESEGGRMRQAAIAEAFDWSPSKTSRVVGKLADDGAVEKLRLGRENLVTLPDDE